MSNSTATHSTYQQFVALFKTLDNEALIHSHNADIDSSNRYTGQGSFKIALLQEFKSRGFDISALIERLDDGFTVIKRTPVRLQNKRLIPLD